MPDPVSATSATYDSIAGAYAARNRSTPPPELERLRQRLLDGTTGALADLGCGPGHDLVALHDAGREAVGVDLSAGMLALAHDRGLPVVRGDLRRPPLRDASLGGIWSSAALLHVPRPDVAATLAAWHALLQPGGLLALMTALGSEERWEPVEYVDAPASRWFVYHARDDLLALLAAAGFGIASYEEWTTHRRWALVTATA